MSVDQGVYEVTTEIQLLEPDEFGILVFIPWGWWLSHRKNYPRIYWKTFERKWSRGSTCSNRNLAYDIKYTQS